MEHFRRSGTQKRRYRSLPWEREVASRIRVFLSLLDAGATEDDGGHRAPIGTDVESQGSMGTSGDLGTGRASTPQDYHKAYRLDKQYVAI